MRRIRWLPLMLVLATAPAIAADATSVRRFERLVHDYYAHYLAASPEEATLLGDHRFDRRTSDLSPAGIAATGALYRRTLAAAEAIPASTLPLDHAVDRDILIVDLRARLFDLEVLKTWRSRVTDYSPTLGVYLLVARDYAPLEQRLAAAKARLDGIPRILAAARRNLDNPPRVFTETAIAQNKGAIAFVRDDLETFVARAPTMRPVLAAARTRAIAALTAHGRWLEQDLLPRSHGEFRFGREHFEQRLRYALDSDLTMADVLARAEAAVVATQKAMEDAALPLHRRYFPDRSTDGLDGHRLVRDVLDRIAEQHPDGETIVGVATRDLEAATRFVGEHRLVTLPTTPVRVIVMPEFQRGPAVAFCDAAGPLEKDGATFYAISPPPADWSPARVASQFREYNDAMIKDLTVHEAMPGHYLQIAAANRVRMPTLVRAMINSGTFVEGWAVYGEQLMAEAGFGGEETRMQQLKMRMRAIVNAIIDQKIHADGMTEQDAVRFMMEVGYQEEGEAVGKWRRAQMSAGQLSTYFVGVEEVSALARDIAARTGGDTLAVNDAMLAHGSIATKYLRRLMRMD